MKQLAAVLTICFGISINMMNGQIVERSEHAINHEPYRPYHLTEHYYDYDNKQNHERRLQQSQPSQQIPQQYHHHYHHHRHQQQFQQQHPQQYQQQQPNQQQHQINEMSSSEKSNKIIINDITKEIFNVSSEPGLHLFSNTLNTIPQLESSHEPLHHNQLKPQPQSQPQPQPQLSSKIYTTSATTSSTSTPASTSTSIGNKFKIQRSPDGKLNLVFDNFLQLQPPIYTGANVEQTHGEHHSTHIVNTENSNRKGPFEVSANDCWEQGKTFCSKVRNYPDLTRLNNILKIHYPDLTKYVVEDALVVQNISQRMNIEPDEEFLCRSKETVYYPEAAQNKEANWFFIVNNSNFKQGVRVEECEGIEAKCSALMSLPSGYYATCKQNYIYRSLIALTPDAKLFTDQFKLPSCCKCVIKQQKN